MALVTGSATGIGRAIAERFARAGAKVAVNYRLSRDPAEELVSQLRSAGTRRLRFGCGCSSDAEARAMFAQVEGEFGRLDILVNNAGWSTRVPHRSLDALTDDIWDKTFDINLHAVFYCIRAAVPLLRKQPGGVIVNVASVARLYWRRQFNRLRSRQSRRPHYDEIARARSRTRNSRRRNFSGLIRTQFAGRPDSDSVFQVEEGVTPLKILPPCRMR